MTKYQTKYRFLLPNYEWSPWILMNEAMVSDYLNSSVLAVEVQECKKQTKLWVYGGNNEITPRTND